MALGIRTESASGANIVPIIKYDARAGKMFRPDRTAGADGWETEQVEITAGFRAVFDMEHIETGWMYLAAGEIPDFKLVPLGQDAGPRPSDGHREGFRVMVKLGKESGGDVREFCHTAKTCIGAFDALHDAYLSGVKYDPGKLPVVVMEKTRPVVTGSGKTQSTNYAPVFKIVAWVARPADLVWKAKGAAAAASAGNGHTTPATPPATGSTRAPPPSAGLKEALESVEEFG